MLLTCVKTIVKESHNFELCSPSEEEEEERKTSLAAWKLAGSVFSQLFFTPLGVLLVTKTLEDE